MVMIEVPEPVAVIADDVPSRLASRAHLHPSDESEFCHRPGSISVLTSQVPGPNGSPGAPEGASRIWVHHPHPSDQKAASVGRISTVKEEPEPATVSVLPSIDEKRFQAHVRERMARHIPGAISSPTSHVPLLNVPLPEGEVVGLGAVEAPATAGPGDRAAVPVVDRSTAGPPPESDVSRTRIIARAASTTPSPPAIASHPRDNRASLARHPPACASP